jgi:hypothetical protein
METALTVAHPHPLFLLATCLRSVNLRVQQGGFAWM